MKATNILLTAMLALMLSFSANAEIVNHSIGTRVDYFNDKGERYYSQTVTGNNVLFSINQIDNKWSVDAAWFVGDETTANRIKFVPWGTESYDVQLDTEVPVEYYVKSSDTRVAKRLKAHSQSSFNVLCGNIIVFEMELPENAYPELNIQSIYTEDYIVDYTGKKSRVPFTELSKTLITDPRILTNPDDLSMEASYWIDGSLRFTRLPSNENCNNRWRYEFEMPNEPCVVKIGYGYADDKHLARTVRDILYGTLYTQHESLNNGGGNSGENWILRNVGEGLSEDQINNFALMSGESDPIFYTGMDCLVKANNDPVVVPWADYYCGIMLSNMLLDNLDLFNSATKTNRDIAKAQLLSLRAHCYTRILQIYGKRWSESENGEALCAPLILDINDMQQPLASMAEIKKQCEDDLNEAIRIFDNANYKQTTLIEPDLNVARGLLMRLALCTEEWQTAREMAQLLVTDVPLTTNDEMRNGFYTRSNSWIWGASTYFPEDNEFGGRPINSGAPQNYDACNGTYVNWLGLGPNAIDRDLWLKISEKDMRREFFVMPELLSEPVNNLASWYQSDYYSMMTKMFVQDAYRDRIIEFYENKHPEAKAFIYENGSVNIPFGAQLKFWGTGEADGYDMFDKDGGTLFMRSDEALLTQAEACWHLGDESTARALLNQLNTMRDEEYNCTATGQDLLDEIRLYRKIELWGEGFSWFDQKRWNLPIKRTLWKEGDTTSGNWPSWVTPEVNTSAANGWRAVIPAYYINQNPNIDISKMGYADEPGYDGTWVDVNSDENLFHGQTITPSFYYAPNWMQVADPGFKDNGNGSYTITLPEATFERWQAQVQLNTSIAIPDATKLYDFCCTVVINKSSNVLYHLGDYENYDNFFFSDEEQTDGIHRLVRKGVRPSVGPMNAVRFIMDFGGCAAGTEVTISNIILQEHRD